MLLCFLAQNGRYADILHKDSITDGKRALKKSSVTYNSTSKKKKAVSFYSYTVMTWRALTNSFLFVLFFSFLFSFRERARDHLGATEDPKSTPLQGCRHIYKHCDMKIFLRHRTATLKEGAEHFNMQERYVYCSFICSHAVRHTRKLLRSLGEKKKKNWHERARD